MEKTDKTTRILDPENCEMCGMCTTVCPTYAIAHNESESPRGRISIIYGLNNSILKPSKSALKHINSCTLCLACETICPAKVNFYQLMTGARNKYFRDQSLIFKIKTKLISKIFTNEILKKIIKIIIKLLNKEKLKKINTVFFKFMNYTQIKKNKNQTNIKKFNKKNIGIFTGCVIDVFQENIGINCANILRKKNINSELIKNIKCCGSLDYNNGRFAEGLKHNKLTVNEFKKNKYEIIIGCGSGCSAFLNKNKGNVNYQDATSYIIDLLENSKNNFKTTFKNICVHQPCTSKLAEINFSKLLKVLKTIPYLKVFTFKENYCCGAGAQNLIHNYENALNIIEPKIKFIEDNHINEILTYNIGCSLNFINSINLKKIKQVEVSHPITFLNERLI